MTMRNREEWEIPKNLRTAVNNHCRLCNDVEKNWNAENDCTVWRCWLYPFRPGKGGEDRFVRPKSEKRAEIGRQRASLLSAARAAQRDSEKKPQEHT